MTAKQRRMVFVALIVLGVAGAVALSLRAFQENLLYFITPSDLLKEQSTAGKSYRLGGLVKPGSVQRTEGTMTTRFVVTDNQHELPVVYTGVLPDLFREGQGVIARGKIADGTFSAEEVLAKHDEKYMPPEVADKLKETHGGQLPGQSTATGQPATSMTQ